MPDPVVILGLGYTTQRLARRLLCRGMPVYAAVRGPERFAELESLGVRLCPLVTGGLPKGAVLIHTVPPLFEPERRHIRQLISEAAPRRILYISSTSVYGAQVNVSESSPVAPCDEKGSARIDEEIWINDQQAGGLAGSSLILRSAAIYGPGRGIHVRLREGKVPRGVGGVVSRIHVDDLVSLLEAGIESQLEGAWPVADDLPAASEEVSSWCAALMGVALPTGPSPGFSVSGRSVDGRRIRELLNVRLEYPTYRTGIPASLQAEALRG